MLDCWQQERADRPKFTAIVKVLDKFKLFPELLIPVAAPRYVSKRDDEIMAHNVGCNYDYSVNGLILISSEKIYWLTMIHRTDIVKLSFLAT